MPYSYSTVPPTPAWVTVEANTGKVTADLTAAPPAGFDGTARIRVTDGVDEAFIDIPIDIEQSATYGLDYVETAVIEWVATIESSTQIIERLEDLAVVWDATIAPQFADEVVLGNVYDETVDLFQSIDNTLDRGGFVSESLALGQSSGLGTSGLGNFEAAINLGQSIADSADDGNTAETLTIGQSAGITIEGVGTYDRSASIAQSADVGAAGGTGGGLAESPVVSGLTFTQSSVYPGTTAATQANMTDLVGTTGTGTNLSGPSEWIQIDFTSRLIRGVRVGGGTIAGFGGTAVYANSSIIQYWTGSAWINLATIAGVTNSGADQFRVFNFAITSVNRLRMLRNNFAAATEFTPIELTGGTTETPITTGLTYSQRSTFGSLTATQTNMTDLNGSTGAATQNTSEEWIEVAFASQVVCGVRVGGGSLAGWGAVAGYTNGATVQYWDGTAWINGPTITGVADSGGAQFLSFYFPLVTTTRIRIRRSGYLATTELTPITIT